MNSRQLNAKAVKMLRDMAVLTEYAAICGEKALWDRLLALKVQIEAIEKASRIKMLRNARPQIDPAFVKMQREQFGMRD